MKKTSPALLALISTIIIFTACEKMMPNAPEDDEILDGPVEGLLPQENAQFLAGDFAFNNDVFFKENGLGPYFVATSCASCHAGDGKGHPSNTLTRFGQWDSTGNLYTPNGAPQLQSSALPGYYPEVVPLGVQFAKFTPPANTGLGFLAALTDSQILAIADPFDSNGDGISGIPNYIIPPTYFLPQSFHQSFTGKYIGRFGKKASAIDLLHQTVNAYNQDMGVTSEYSPYEPQINGLTYPYPDGVADPEVSNNIVLNLVFYLRTLKAPIQRNQNDSDVIEGKQIFITSKCSSCHIQQWTTGSSDISALSYKTFYPYTDLLLHDMGSGLDDGYTEGTAQTYEWRTPPLWGLGLSRSSQGGEYFLMHDGRASSIDQAILMHGGEASNSKIMYQGLSNLQRQKLIKFLESL